MADDSGSPLSSDTYRALVDDLLVGVYLIQDDRLVYANPALGRIFGYSREDMLRLSSVLDVIADTHRELVADKLRQRLTGEITTIEYRVQGVRRDGEIIDLDVRSVRTQHRDRPAVIGTMIDITEQLRHEQALRELSVTDSLTGLYNRRGFLTLAHGHLALAQRHKRSVSLILADLDNLKGINDQYGHAAGDRALVAVARLLRQTYRSADVVARLGGDEFAVFPLEVTEDAVPRLVERLEQHLEDHNRLRVDPFVLSISVGVGRYNPEECRTVDDLLEAADARLYERKRQRQG